MVKTLARTFVVAAMLFAATTAFAAIQSDVYVTDTVVDQAGPFTAGQTVTGHFTLKNFGSNSLDLPTSLSLMTGFSEGELPQTLVDSFQLPSVHLAPNATVAVPFSVEVPKAFTGDIGFQGNVEVILGRSRTGVPVGPYKVEGGIARADITSYVVDLSNGKLANPFEGVSLYRDHEPSTATLAIDVTSTAAFAVTPKIVLYENTNAAGSEPIYSGGGTTTGLSVGTSTVRLPLPMLDYPDKVVFGAIRLVDKDGIDRSGVAYFRYIPRTGQTIGRIVSTAFDGTPAPGVALNVHAALAGSPLDFNISEASTTLAQATYRFEALDGQGNVVAFATSSSLTLGPKALDLTMSLSLPDVPYLTYRATLVDDASGRELDRREGLLFGEPAVPFWGSPAATILVVTLLVAILGILAIMFMYFRRPPAPPASVVRAVGAIAIAICLVAGARHVGAASVTSTVHNETGVATLDFSQPYPGQVFQCGAKIPVVVSAAYDICTNSPYGGTLTVSLNGKVIAGPSADGGGPSRGHDVVGDSLSALVSMPLPVRNGTYTLTAHLSAWAWEWKYDLTESRTFQVVGCDVCSNIPGDQSAVPAGMVGDNGGSCSCPSGASFDAAKGECVNPNGSSYNSCPNGKKWCNGACVPEATVCAPGPDACPLPDTGEQYCVELFHGDGNRTTQLSTLSLEDLEAVFGFGVREAYYALTGVKGAATAKPIFGVVGRSSSGSVTATQGSAGCGGVTCAYGSNGCIDSVDPNTGDARADCSSPNDVPGPSGIAPTALLNVDPSVVGKGGSCKVYWSSHEMSSCTTKGNGVDADTLAGAAKTPALQSSATYVLTCKGQDGKTYTDSDSCAVDPSVIEF